MALSSDQIIRITKEEALGIAPKEIDSIEESEFRVTVAEEIREIKAAGMVVEIPYEIPEFD